MTIRFYIWLGLLLFALFALVHEFDRTSKIQFMTACQLEKPREDCLAEWDKVYPGSMVN